MTEAQWLACEEPAELLDFMTLDQRGTGWRHLSEHKLQMIQEAWGSSLCGDERYCLASLYPDGPAKECFSVTANIMKQFRPVAAALLRDIAGNPYHVMTVRRPLPWIVTNLALAAYDERLPSGTLDPARLSVLADAVEESAWVDERILKHLRSPIDHVRGCWVIDLLLERN